MSKDKPVVQHKKRSQKVVVLPTDFTPSKLDVLCGRDVGPESYQYPGNQQFRRLVQSSLEPYMQCKTKFDKGLIVMSLVDTIRNKSPNGGFIKFDRETQSWLEIGDEAARKKVGHAIREALLHLDPSKRQSRQVQQAASRAKRRTKTKPESEEEQPAEETASSPPATASAAAQQLLDETPTSDIFSQDPDTRAMVQRVARQYGMMAQAMATRELQSESTRNT